MITIAPLLLSAVLVGAHSPRDIHNHIHAARQASSSSKAASPTGAATSHPAASPAPPGSPAASASQVSVSPLSANPTAIPLASIIANQPTSATIPLSAVPTAGAKCSHISNCPPLPNLSTISAANYPALDKLPPTNTPQVQQWIQQVQQSGIQIPNLSPTNPGGCPNNTNIVSDASRCWWTCGGCVRDEDVSNCPDKLTWGLTYDDGPAFYTPNLMDYLSSEKLTGTFFDVGSRVISNPATAQAEHMAGHQLGVHTWSHPPLTTLSNEEIIAELGWTKKVIQDVTGVTPLFFRPPFGDIDDRVRAIAKAMNLAPVMWTRLSPLATFDTDDFDVHGGLSTSSQVISNFQHILNNATTISTGFIVLEHDLFQESVELATGYIIPSALAFQPKLTIQPVITCSHKDFGSAYLETNNNSTNPLPSASNAVAVGTNTAAGAAQTGQQTGQHSNAGAVQIGLLSVLGGLAFAAVGW